MPLPRFAQYNWNNTVPRVAPSIGPASCFYLDASLGAAPSARGESGCCSYPAGLFIGFVVPWCRNTVTENGWTITSRHYSHPDHTAILFSIAFLIGFEVAVNRRPRD
jgi:hypothetical protein